MVFGYIFMFAMLPVLFVFSLMVALILGVWDGIKIPIIYFLRELGCSWPSLVGWYKAGYAGFKKDIEMEKAWRDL